MPKSEELLAGALSHLSVKLGNTQR